MALFFLAFMPQFLQPELGHLSLQMVQLGLVFIIQTVAVFGLFASLPAALGRLLARQPALRRGSTGSPAGVHCAGGAGWLSYGEVGEEQETIAPLTTPHPSPLTLPHQSPHP